MDLYKTPKKSRREKKQRPQRIITSRENMIVGSVIAIIGGAGVGWFSYNHYSAGVSNLTALIIQFVIAAILVGFGIYKLIFTLTSKRYSRQAAEEERKVLEKEAKKTKRYS